MSDQSMSDQSINRAPQSRPRFSLDWLSLDTWAVAAAVIFIVLVVAGVFPRVPW